MHCVNIKYSDENFGMDKNLSMKKILSNSSIRAKIEYESKKLGAINQIDSKDLEDSIKTEVFMLIRNEFKPEITDVNKIESWIFSRIGWRALDYIKKKCELSYSQQDKEYSKKMDKVYIDDPIYLTENLQEIREKEPTISTSEISFLSDNTTLESFINHSPIDDKHKELLSFCIEMQYSFADLSAIYGLSEPTVRKRYDQAVKKLKEHICNLSKKDCNIIYNLLENKSGEYKI